MFSDTLPDSIIKRLSIRVKQAGGINLGQGIPSFPTAGHIIRAARAALDDPGIGVYPNFLGTLELRQAIADKLNGQYKTGYTPEKNILVTVGAMEATAASVFAVVQNGDRVGVISPDYCNHLPQIQLSRGIPVEIPCLEARDWGIDGDCLENEAKQGMKLLIVTNPGNPTGAVFSRQDLDTVVRLGKQYGFWILSDETYGFLTYGRPFVSMIDYAETYDRILTVRSFSKEYAMTGWRVGYVVGNASAISGIARVHDALTGCVPKISQKAAVAALTGPQDIVAEYVSVLSRRRTMVCGFLDGITGLSYIQPQGAYYVFPRYTEKIPSVEMGERILVSAGVAVVPGSAFGSAGEYHIRISFAVDDGVLEEGMTRLAKFFRNNPV